MNWHWLRFSKSIVLKKQYQKSRTNWIGNFVISKKNLNLFKSSPVTWNTTAPYSFNRYDWSKRCLKCYRYSSLISYTSIAVKMYLTMAKLIFFFGFLLPPTLFFGGTSCFLTRIHWYMYLWQWTWNKRRIPTPCFFVCTKTSRNKHETFFGLNKTHYINC